jgi:hypothetical protein
MAKNRMAPLFCISNYLNGLVLEARFIDRAQI